jgi:Uncharacterized protein conserved in bacteria
VKVYAAFLPMRDAEKSAALRPQHLEYLETLEREGKILARGPFADGSGGLVLYLAESLEEARQLAEGDPYVVHGARGLALHEWNVTGKLVER